MILHIDLMSSFFHAALTQAKIDQLVACLFDKDPLVARPACLLAPYYSENPPPTVRVFAFIVSLFLLLINLISLWTQGIYPDPHTDVEVSNGEDNALKPDALDGKEKAPAGDDAEDGGVTLAEPISPNLIRSNTSE
jgi:hypothetical protein